MPRRPREPCALCWLPPPVAAGWGPPLIDHVGETVTAPTNRDEPVSSCVAVPQSSKNRLGRSRRSSVVPSVSLDPDGRVSFHLPHTPAWGRLALSPCFHLETQRPGPPQ